MKTLKVILIVTFLVAIFASVSIVSAATSMEGTATGYWSTTNPAPGTQVTLTVNFESGSSDTIYLIGVGVHGDWMSADGFYGPNLSEDPVAVETGGLYSTKIILAIPASASIGEHSYYIGIDGYDQNGDSFSWDSSSYTVTFAPASNPTSTNSGGNSGGNTNTGNTGGVNNLLVYVAVIAVVAVLAIVLAIVIVKRKSHKTPTVTPEAEYAPTFAPAETPKTEQKPKREPEPEPEPETQEAPSEEPEEQPSNDKDFNI